MFNGQATHLILKSNDLQSTRNFYETILEIKPQTNSASYLTYSLGPFLLGFKLIEEQIKISCSSQNNSEILKSIYLQDNSIVHLGIEFKTQREIEYYFNLLKNKKYKNMSAQVFGGIKLGPYRFYVTDPNGYTLEFESWENCSD